MRKRKNILYIEQNLDGTTGGSYRSLLYLVKLLDKRQFRPVVAFYREHDLLPEFRNAGCKVIILRYPQPIDIGKHFSFLKGRLLSIFRMIPMLVQKSINFTKVSLFLFIRNLYLLIKEDIDLVHLNNGVTGGTEMLIAATVLRIKCLVHQRGIGPVPRWNLFMTKWIYHIICVSDAAKKNLLSIGIPSTKCTTIHNGIAPEEFLSRIKRDPKTIRDSLGFNTDCFIVGIAGMIRAWKGQIVLVKAMLKLREKYPNLQCLIVGGVSDQQLQDRAYLKEISDFIQKYNLSSQIKIIDYQENIADFLGVFDVMIHTAIDPEPFSRAVLEGMTMGRAIIATRTGGTPEAIEDNVSGILIPPNDPSVLADKIDYLIQHPEVRRELGTCAKERIYKKFLIQNNVDSTVSIYHEVFPPI